MRANRQLPDPLLQLRCTTTPHQCRGVRAVHTGLCLHPGTADLYKLASAVPGGLMADCFELAVRELDMRASPYDLTGHH